VRRSVSRTHATGGSALTERESLITLAGACAARRCRWRASRASSANGRGRRSASTSTSQSASGSCAAGTRAIAARSPSRGWRGCARAAATEARWRIGAGSGSGASRNRAHVARAYRSRAAHERHEVDGEAQGSHSRSRLHSGAGRSLFGSWQFCSRPAARANPSFGADGTAHVMDASLCGHTCLSPHSLRLPPGLRSFARRRRPIDPG
jgi:hypothetical protein